MLTEVFGDTWIVPHEFAADGREGQRIIEVMLDRIKGKQGALALIGDTISVVHPAFLPLSAYKGCHRSSVVGTGT
jgi:hypothetical protein